MVYMHEIKLEQALKAQVKLHKEVALMFMVSIPATLSFFSQPVGLYL